MLLGNALRAVELVIGSSSGTFHKSQNSQILFIVAYKPNRLPMKFVYSFFFSLNKWCKVHLMCCIYVNKNSLFISFFLHESQWGLMLFGQKQLKQFSNVKQ